MTTPAPTDQEIEAASSSDSLFRRLLAKIGIRGQQVIEEDNAKDDVFQAALLGNVEQAIQTVNQALNLDRSANDHDTITHERDAFVWHLQSIRSMIDLPAVTFKSNIDKSYEMSPESVGKLREAIRVSQVLAAEDWPLIQQRFGLK